jgi:nucleotide-binding universal stress UspA family protein
MTKIVLGYDGSDSAKQALNRVAEMNAADTAVTVVCAVDTLIRSRVPHGPVVDPIVEEERHEALEAARQTLEKQGHKPTLLEAVGDPATCIIQAATQSDADLVVVGSRNQGLADRVLHGSVSTKLAHECPCDLLIARDKSTA